MKCQVGSHQYACHVEWIVNVKVAHMLARQPPGASVILSAHAKDLSCVRLPAVWGRFFGCSLRMTAQEIGCRSDNLTLTAYLA